MKNILIIFLVLITCGPFFNQAMINQYHININYIYAILFIPIIVLLPVTLSMMYINKNKLNMLIINSILLVLYLIPNIKNLYDPVKLFTGFFSFLFVYLFLLYDFDEKDIQKIINITLIISIAGIIISINDFEKVIKGFNTNSRMIYDASPISISVLAGISIISLIFTNLNRTVKILFFLLLLSILFLLMSRGPFLALALTLIIYFIKKRKYIISTLLLFSGFAGGIYLYMIRGGKTVSLREGYYKEVANLYEIGKDFFFGAGVGSFGNYSDAFYPHNILLELIVEIGPVFLMIFIFLLFILFIKFLGLRLKYNRNKLFFFLMAFYFIMVLQFSLSGIEHLRVLLPYIFLFMNTGVEGRRDSNNLTEAFL